MGDVNFTCDKCGGQLRASSEEQLVKAVREHEREEHGRDMSEGEIQRKIKQGRSS